MDLTPLMDVVRTLRSPGGCPWDQAQDHKSMRRELVEEVYELLEAIDDGDVKGIREELGDVLFQVVFHARLAEEVGAFTMQDVITDVSRKLIHRHPHVYGTVTVGSAEELLKNWDALKAEEKKERKSALDGIARDLPSLMRAYKLSERSSRRGFDWPDADCAYEKVKEEENELKEAILSKNKDHVEEELGDLFLPSPSMQGNWDLNRRQPFTEPMSNMKNVFGKWKKFFPKKIKNGKIYPLTR